MNRFQSLFSWNLLLMAMEWEAGMAQISFQSLFSWNLLLMNTVRLDAPDSAWFQSLFSWNLLLMSRNYEGLWSRTIRFQSLFSWNLLLMVLLLRISSHTSYVSILVFVELALDGLKSKSNSLTATCFNPCFRGTCSWWPGCSGLARSR